MPHPTLPFPLGVTPVMLPELDLDEQLSLCRSLGVTHYCYRPRIIPDDQVGKAWSNWGNHKFDLTPQRLLDEAKDLRKQVLQGGMIPFGSVPSLRLDSADDDLLRLCFQGAAQAGAGRVRVSPKAYPNQPFDYQQRLKETVADYQHAVRLAKPWGIKVVIETHCGSLATSPGLAFLICQHFDPNDLGVIFDFPNFSLEGGISPQLAVSVLLPYIDHCHVGGAKRTDGQIDSAGFRQAGREMTSLRDSDLHIPTWLTALHHACPGVPLVIEDYADDLPGPDRLMRTVDDLKKIMETL